MRAASLRLIAIAALLATAAGLALWVGYALGPPLFLGRSGSGIPAAMADRLALRVLTQPRPAPAFTFRDGNGKARSLAAFRGRLVLLNLWATWCAPCRREMPTLDRLQARLGGRNFLVLPVSLDQQGAKAVAAFYRRAKLTHLGVYLDPSGQAATLFAARALPTSVLIDRAGREVARKLGPADWDGARMIALIRRFLPPTSPSRDGPPREAAR